MANHELIKLTSHQVTTGGYSKAILAVGSCEAHGPHLASGTDTLVSYMLSCQVADHFDDLLVLPHHRGIQRPLRHVPLYPHPGL